MFAVKAIYLGAMVGMRREFVVATFNDERSAREYALKANCKPHSPYFFSVMAGVFSGR